MTLNTLRVRKFSKFLYKLTKTDSMKKFRVPPKSSQIRVKWRQMFQATMMW